MEYNGHLRAQITQLQSDLSASRDECERYRSALDKIMRVAASRESNRFEVESIARTALEATK